MGKCNHHFPSSQIMLLLLSIQILLTSTVVAVRVKDDTPLDPRTPAPNSKFCVAVSPENAVCSSDPMAIRRKFDSPNEHNNLGVEQRIDGTDSEQKSIKEVLKLMNLYWNEEVLSNQEYTSVRTTWYDVLALPFASTPTHDLTSPVFEILKQKSKRIVCFLVRIIVLVFKCLQSRASNYS